MAGRDDLRASLGQAHVVRRCTELASEVHARFAVVLGLESRIGRRTGTLLHAVLAATAVVGVTLVVDDRLDHRVAGHPVHGHDDVRRSGRHARTAPAGPAGRLRRRAAAARAPRCRPRARRGRRAADRAAGRGAAGPALRLRRGTFRPPARRPGRPGGHHVRPGGAHRLGQVDAGVAAVPGRRARAGLGPPRRCRRARRGPAAPARRRRRGHPADRDPRRDPGGEHHALHPGAAPRGRARCRRARPRGLGGRAPGRAGHAARARRQHPVRR